jgi:hypothetical protein
MKTGELVAVAARAGISRESLFCRAAYIEFEADPFNFAK